MKDNSFNSSVKDVPFTIIYIIKSLSINKNLINKKNFKDLKKIFKYKVSTPSTPHPQKN